ncbi:AraC family transcriptional regulator [Solimonas sp. K1W22B-7]|nr:AraC family transcriptional regulator [Solimonas sp. K1W22B-7]
MTDSNIFFLHAHAAMKRAGIDVEEIYRRIGINSSRLMKAGASHPHQYQAVFWQAVEQYTGDPEIGLHLCPQLSPFAGEVLTHLFVSSPTLGVGLERVLRYIRLVSDDLSLQLSRNAKGPEAVLAGKLGDDHTPRHSEITFFYGFIKAARYCSGDLFKPSLIELRCSEGEAEEEFESIFGCPVRFRSAETRCYFPRELLDLPLPHADPELASVHELVAQRRMRKVMKRDRTEEVRRIISTHIEGGRCMLSDVSAELGCSPRSLRNELLDAGTTFNQILVETRQALAKHLLISGTEPVERIAYLTGFSERSAFFRAFKSWTGLTPLQFRTRCGQQENDS